MDPSTLSATELNRLFAAGSAAMPHGVTDGTGIVAPGTWLCRPLAWLLRHTIWQGKVFDERRMRNRVAFWLGFPALVSIAPSRIDGLPCILLDYAILQHWIQDEMREIEPGLYLGQAFWKQGRSPWMYFTLQVR